MTASHVNQEHTYTIILEASLPGPWARVNAAAATGRVRHELCKSGVEEEETQMDGRVRCLPYARWTANVSNRDCVPSFRPIYLLAGAWQGREQR